MEKKARFKRVVAGNGGSANGTVSLQGEKMSADREGGEDFITFFTEFIQEKGFTLDQIFNCDETGLNFRLLPDSTLATAFEKSADGWKKSKESDSLCMC